MDQVAAASLGTTVSTGSIELGTNSRRYFCNDGYTARDDYQENFGRSIFLHRECFYHTIHLFLLF